jgi:hypothetical protein
MNIRLLIVMIGCLNVVSATQERRADITLTGQSFRNKNGQNKKVYYDKYGNVLNLNIDLSSVRPSVEIENYNEANRLKVLSTNVVSFSPRRKSM